MNSEEIVEIVQKINNDGPSPVDKNILKRIILLVIDHPVEDDRGICQEELRKLIIEKVG